MTTFQIDQQSFFVAMLSMRDDINLIKGTIQGSVATQAAMAADIEAIKLRVSTNESDIRSLKNLRMYAIGVWTIAAFGIGAVTSPEFSVMTSLVSKFFG